LSLRKEHPGNSGQRWSTKWCREGPTFPDEEIETVVEYLAKNFGATNEAPPTGDNRYRNQSVNVNKASAVQLEEALGLSAKESAAIVSYREHNGTFRGWQDLTKVPGIETSKMERNKARVTF
jgi:competence ComEA-like helix-hairpin-helix protein